MKVKNQFGSNFVYIIQLLMIHCIITHVYYVLRRFAMEVAGVYYVAEVKEKEEAWNKYRAAVDTGVTAGDSSV